MAYEKDIKKGVTNFGYVTNIKTFIQEANEVLAAEEKQFSAFDFNAMVDNLSVNKSVITKTNLGKTQLLKMLYMHYLKLLRKQ